jgi:hypothetical protein
MGVAAVEARVNVITIAACWLAVSFVLGPVVGRYLRSRNP